MTDGHATPCSRSHHEHVAAPSGEPSERAREDVTSILISACQSLPFAPFTLTCDAHETPQNERAFGFNKREGDDTHAFAKALESLAGLRITYDELTAKTSWIHLEFITACS